MWLSCGSVCQPHLCHSISMVSGNPFGFYTILEALRNRNFRFPKSGINHGARRILNFYLSFSHDSSTYKIVLNYDFGKKIEYSKKTSSWEI